MLRNAGKSELAMMNNISMKSHSPALGAVMLSCVAALCACSGGAGTDGSQMMMALPATIGGSGAAVGTMMSGAPSAGAAAPQATGTGVGASAAGSSSAAPSDTKAAGAPANSNAALTTPDAGVGNPGAGMGGQAAGMGGPSGSGANAGTGGGAAGSGMTTNGADTRPDQGMGDGKDVITIGDSWMNLGSVGIELSLDKVSMRPYRNFGVGGTKLLDGAIPGQYEMAKKQAPVKTVIMTGGGNDILQEILVDCLDTNFGDTCKKQIDAVAAGLTKLWAEMSTDGVTDVVIVGYSKKTMPLGLGSTAKSIDYSAMKITPLCAMVAAPLRCTSFDSDKEVPNLMTRSDGIHPDDASYDAIAAAVWKLMQAKGMRR
jgi:lysophospholipase L1-like esterase